MKLNSNIQNTGNLDSAMPSHKAIHIVKSHKPTAQPKLANKYVFANASKKKAQAYNNG